MQWDILCDSLWEDNGLSRCFRTRFLRTVVPVAPLLFFLAIQILRNTRVRIPFLNTLSRVFCAPFSQYLLLRDLAEYDPSLPRLQAPLWKKKALIYLSAIQGLSWVSVLFYQVGILHPSPDIVASVGVNAVAWCATSLVIWRRRSNTPPYPIILFYVLHAVSAAVDLLSDIGEHTLNAKVRDVIADGLRLLSSLGLTWIAGSFPLREELPSPHVAKAKDPPSNELSSPEDRVDMWAWLSFSFVEPIMDLAVQRSKTRTTTTPAAPKIIPGQPMLASDAGGASDGLGVPSSSTTTVHSSPSIAPSTESETLLPAGDTTPVPVPPPGQPRTLNAEDVWSLPPTFTHRNLFNKYLEIRGGAARGSGLTWFLLRSNSLDLSIDLAVEFWKAVVGFVPPFALQQILSLLTSSAPGAREKAYLYGLLTFVAHLTFAQLDLFRGWHSRRCYERTRGQLFCALHWKALQRRALGGRAVNDTDTTAAAADLGKVVNLMQGDTYAVAQRFWEFSPVFAAPVRLAIALVFLYNVLGWSALAGVLVVLVAWVLNYPLARWNISITRASWKAKDARMSGVDELFQNIRFLKVYGWDNLWAGRVNGLRERELAWRVKEAIVDTIISFIWTWVPSATAVLSFMWYTLIAGEDLTVSKAFVSVALFEQLQQPMTALPGQVFALLHAYVSMQRIEAFLEEEEVPAWASSLKAAPDLQHEESSRLGFECATFEWHAPSKNASSSGTDTPSRFRLTELDITFPPGKMTLIAGRTGSGKSALLYALLGEMHCLSGIVHVDKRGHRLAFCGQTSWLEHATVRDNVLYGCAFDAERYTAVLDACALERDLAALPAGDMTEIGEKGVTLSGGQRARVALARAVYSRAEVILMDDPLAAVDMHTARHIYERCLAGDLLKGCTIILVTHHVTLCLPSAAYVVELAGGRVAHQGTVEELQRAGHLRHVVEEEVSSTSDLAPRETAPAPENEADRAPDDEKELEQPQLAAPPSSRLLPKGRLVEAEARAEGRVKVSTYLTYVRACGWGAWILTLTLMLSVRGITIGNQMFLAQWGQAYNPSSHRPPILGSLPSPTADVRPWLMIFLLISFAGALSTLLYIAVGYYSSLRASRRLFVAMLFRLVRAPSRFFDVTPLGRILNRFVSDFGTVDGALNNSARDALSGLFTFLSSFGVIVVLVPSFLPFAAFIAYLYVRLAPAYILASRDLRRLELTSLSPTFAGFDELLQGLAHVRAFGMEMWYQERFYKKVDKFQSFDHVYWLLNVWMRWRYDCLGSVVVFCATVFSLWSGVNSGLAAVVIVQAGVFAEASRQLIKVSAQLELDFNSVERIAEYLDVPSEAPAVIQNRRPPAYWPSSEGRLVVEDLTVQYARDLLPVLNNLSFSVEPGEKIGVVGRTGSGKSTLALSFLRMVEHVGGRIIVDGIDISTIGLEDLRTRITIISQDVSLFSGTIRSNIDPFDEHDDLECWDVLRRCHLVSEPDGGTGPIQSLDMPISQSGSLSAGEKQLVALARAVLRRSQIVLMDEATSQVDIQLDDMIQRTIREELKSAMVITIAHRLKTVIDYDKILVLGSDGRILEFDKPHNLLTNSTSAFANMCRRSPDWPELKATTSGKNT